MKQFALISCPLLPGGKSPSVFLKAVLKFACGNACITKYAELLPIPDKTPKVSLTSPHLHSLQWDSFCVYLLFFYFFFSLSVKFPKVLRCSFPMPTRMN
jgi:hypothetical protein